MSEEGIAGSVGTDTGGGGGGEGGGTISGAQALGLEQSGSSQSESTPSVPTETPGVDAGSAAQQPAGEPTSAPETPRAWRFADREWPNQERAEREFQTMVGRTRAAEQRMRELEHMVQVLEGRGSTAESASGGNGNGHAAQGKADDDFSSILDPNSLDWKTVQEAVESGDVPLAMYLMAQATAKQINERINGRLEREIGPLKPAFDQVGRSTKIYGMLEQASMAVDDQGNLLVPELSRDPGYREKIIATLRNMRASGDFPDEFVEGPKGFSFAVNQIRAYEIINGQSNSPAGGGAAQPPPIHPAAQALVQNATAAAQSRGVLPPQRGAQPGRQPERQMSEEESVRSSLLQRETETAWGIPR